MLNTRLGDKADSLERIQDALKGIQHWIYTTHSHNPSNDNNCMRVFIHTTDELNQTNYRDAYWNLINSNSGLKKLGLNETNNLASLGFFFGDCKTGFD